MRHDLRIDKGCKSSPRHNRRARADTMPGLGALLCLLAALVSEPSGADDLSMESLAWLAGCWARSDQEPGSGEIWTSLAGGTLFGISRTVSDGQTVFHEFLEIHRDASGTIQYVAHPRGQAPTAFALVSMDGGRYRFENPDHDFPQRIIYEPANDGSLAAWIEGSVNDTERRIDFPMQRTECSNGQ